MVDGTETGRQTDRSDERTHEDEIAQAWVEAPPELNATITLAEYDPEWPRRYERLAATVRAALGDRVRLLEHVGSTSVPGLVAKPRIDMVLAVADSADEDGYVLDLETSGFRLTIREPDWFEHRVLTRDDEQVNLHIFAVGCPEIDEMLRFRDWLRQHEDDRGLYARSKRELAAQTWRYTQHYADAKGEVVSEIKARVRAAMTPTPDQP